MKPKPTIWTAVASDFVAVLDDLDMTKPPTGIAEAKQRLAEARERTRLTLAAFRKSARPRR